MTENELNQLTAKCTAFPSWEEFEAAMTRNGYVPTLRPHAGKSKAQREWNNAVVRLADEVERRGFRVFRGAGK